MWFYLGLTIGILIATPLGPVGIFCIKKNLTQGRVSGLTTRLGAATADAFYGIVAAWSLTVVSGFILDNRSIFKGIGIILIFFMGMKIFLRDTRLGYIREVRGRTFLSDYFTGFFLTLTSPATLIGVIEVFAWIDRFPDSPLNSLFFVGGIFAGSASWWFITTLFAERTRHYLDEDNLIKINRIVGALLIVFALGLLMELLLFT